MPTTLTRKDWFSPDDFPLAVERREPQTEFGIHSHEFSEIVIITAGRGMHVTGRVAYPLNAGDVFVIGGSRAHVYREMEQLCLVNILFQPDNLTLPNDDLLTLPGYHALFTLEPTWRQRHRFESRLHLSPPALQTAMVFVEALETELRRRAAGFRLMSTAVFWQLVGWLSRQYAESKNPDAHALLRIGQSISHLETHFREPMELGQLAEIAHMSLRSFMRCFQAATGASPIAYLIQLRLNHAATLLRKTEASITEVAFQAGFGDSNYFTRQFRERFGINPLKYRRQSGLFYGTQEKGSREVSEKLEE